MSESGSWRDDRKNNSALSRAERQYNGAEKIVGRDNQKKCRLLTSASRNSDAEIAAENLCLAEEYAKAATFFDELNY